MDDDTLFDKVLNVFKHKKNDSPDETAEPVAVAAAPATLGTPLPVTKSAGELMLIKVDDPTAAVIIAIISNQSKIALNRLSFKSIKLLEDKR